MHADNGTLPVFLHRDSLLGGEVYLESATLVPYAVGRTIDQRLVNDRTGRGGTGGNTRDTTVARGQFMDIRILREIMNDGSGTVVFTKDSTIVDVEVRDTTFVLTRSRPVLARATEDTGHFVDGRLVIATDIDYRIRYGMPIRRMLLSYQITR